MSTNPLSWHWTHPQVCPVFTLWRLVFSKRGPFTCPCELGLVTHWMLWSLGKASGGDSVKDKWPGPASSTELEGNPSCSAMNQRVPSGREAVCLLHSPCHRSKPYRHQASPRRQPKQQFPIYLQPVEPWKLQSTSTHKVQGSWATLAHSTLGGTWVSVGFLTWTREAWGPWGTARLTTACPRPSQAPANVCPTNGYKGLKKQTKEISCRHLNNLRDYVMICINSLLYTV